VAPAPTHGGGCGDNCVAAVGDASLALVDGALVASWAGTTCTLLEEAPDGVPLPPVTPVVEAWGRTIATFTAGGEQSACMFAAA